MIKQIDCTILASNPLGSIKPTGETLGFPFNKRHVNEFLSRFRSTKVNPTKTKRISSTIAEEYPLGIYVDYYA